MSTYSNQLQPALQNLLQRVVRFFHPRSSSTTHISADVQRITLNASCMTISGGRTKQVDIFCHVTGFMSVFLSFIVVELIQFFHGAIQFIVLSNKWQIIIFSSLVYTWLGVAAAAAAFSLFLQRSLQVRSGLQMYPDEEPSAIADAISYYRLDALPVTRPFIQHCQSPEGRLIPRTVTTYSCPFLMYAAFHSLWHVLCINKQSDKRSTFVILISRWHASCVCVCAGKRNKL